MMTTTDRSSLLARLAADLRVREEALRAVLQHAASAAVAAIDEPVEVGDFKDVAAIDSDAQLQDLTTDHALAELAQVRAALRRIADGSYGLCTACGNVIDERRLAALPAAALCTECQSVVERSAALRAH